MLSLGFKSNKFVSDFANGKTIGNQNQISGTPIMVQLAQGIARPLLSVMLNVKLFCGGVQFFENFTLYDLDKNDVIIGNTFLDAYKVDIFYNGRKLRNYTKVGSKLVNLEA